MTPKERGFFVVFWAQVLAPKTPHAVKTTDNPAFRQGQVMRICYPLFR
jgi:hypothetical protein